ncbi:hypothetical protein DFH09DRAFT_1102032 [Mycena vulgaris]|nr:hypothetical protein DFH09DRAFT_1102032 [Mycena vulgaris]
MKKERTHVESVLKEFGETVRRAEPTIASQRETARLERNAKQRATRQKKTGDESELEDEVEEEESERSDEHEESSSEEEAANEHPRSSPIPPPPKRMRHVLKEVTNEERPVSRPAKKTGRAGLQSAAQVTQSFSNPYRTTSRRRAAQD